MDVFSGVILVYRTQNSSLADEGNMNASSPMGGLSPRAERIIRVLSTWTVLGLAISAAILSFAGLQQLSLEAGFSHSIAWLLPIVIDGMVLTGSLGVVSSSLAGASTWYPWTLTITGVIASIAGNVAIAHPNLSSRLVHATGPITFALSIEGLLRIYRASAVATAERDRVKAAKEEAEIEKQNRREEREERKAARLLEASLLPATTPVVLPLAPTTVTIEKKVTPPNKNGESVKERILTLMVDNPKISGAEVARQLNIDDSYARRIIRDIHKEQEKSATEIPLENTQVINTEESLSKEIELAPVVIAEEMTLEQVNLSPIREENPFALDE